MKMTTMKKVVMSFAFAAAALLAVNTTDVKAANLNTKPVKEMQTAAAVAPAGTTTITAQTDFSDSSVKISYTYDGTDARYFDAFISMDPNAIDLNTPYSTSTYIYSDGTGKIGGLQGGTTYYVVIRPYNGSSSNKVYGNPSNVFEVITCPNVKPEITFFGSASTTSIQVNWTPVAGASGYYVAYYDEAIGPDGAQLAQTADCEISIDGLTQNTSYAVKVYPYRANSAGQVAFEENMYTTQYGISLMPTKDVAPVVTSYSKSSGYFYVQTERISQADGYEYDVYTAFKKKDTKVKTFEGGKYDYNLKLQNKAFKKSNLYKIRVRAFTFDKAGNRQYGEWSDFNYIGMRDDSYKRAKGGLQTTWKKLNGASRYVILVSTNKTKGYKKFTTTTKTSCVITKCGKKKLTKKKTYYVRVVAQKKVGKKFVNVDDPYCTVVTY